jgi:hypothetical protein
MRLLKIAAADFGRGDMGGDGQHRHVVAVAVKQAVDQMQVAGPQEPAQTASSPVSCASAPAAKAATSSWRVGIHSMVHLVEAVAKSVQGIAGDAPDTFHASLFERFRNICSHGLFHGCPSPFCDNAYKLRRKSPYCPSSPH